ncbi:MAG: hypothetical protein ACYDDW_20705, partial [Dermatophilaceae bacterium]
TAPPGSNTATTLGPTFMTINGRSGAKSGDHTHAVSRQAAKRIADIIDSPGTLTGRKTPEPGEPGDEAIRTVTQPVLNCAYGSTG